MAGIAWEHYVDLPSESKPPTMEASVPRNSILWHFNMSIFRVTVFCGLFGFLFCVASSYSAYVSLPIYSIAAPGPTITSTILAVSMDNPSSMLNYDCSNTTMDISHYGINVGQAHLPKVNLKVGMLANKLVKLDDASPDRDNKQKMDSWLVQDIRFHEKQFDATFSVTAKGSNWLLSFDDIRFKVTCPVKVESMEVEGFIKATYFPCKTTRIYGLY